MGSKERLPMAERPLDLYRLAFELSPSGIIVIDASGAIVLANREVERLFGYESDELIGRSIDALVPERFRAKHPGFRQGFFHSPQARPMGAGRDLFGLRKDGSEIPVEIGLKPIETDRGTFVLSSVVDITARRSLEDRLRQAQKMEAIGTLAGGIAHDFNNLLRAILGYSELVAGALNSPQAQADLDQVRRAAERGQELVQRILTFSRHRELARTPMHLSRPLQDAIYLLRASLPTTIELRTHFDADAPAVFADDTQVHQIVMNLVTNAAQALGDAPGTVAITLAPFQADQAFVLQHPNARPGLHALLTVADTGPGMPSDVAGHAFEPFFTTKPVGAGTGLGLAVVHGIVQGSGGAVELESVVGQGTTVRVYFPAAPDVAREVAPEPTGPHILFVEDEEVLASLSRRQLEASGFTVTAFTSSLQALEAFRASPESFDAVVTDNTMPRMSGMALAQEILRIRPGTRILLVSGLVEMMDPGVLYAKGVSGILGKPHTGQQLVQAIKEILVGRL
jgi:PAS domain S-box-containing protein